MVFPSKGIQHLDVKGLHEVFNQGVATLEAEVAFLGGHMAIDDGAEAAVEIHPPLARSRLVVGQAFVDPVTHQGLLPVVHISRRLNAVTAMANAIHLRRQPRRHAP